MVSKYFNLLKGRTGEHCIAKWDRDMLWNWTYVGSVARQPCPGGASGFANWRCLMNTKTRTPMWFPSTPDFSDCKSAWFQSLLVSDIICLKC